ncbi:MAG: hypothetical protein IKM28_01665, partial [Lachnospiraceae bacterium]|nr:hypothetical protein [Lachnospiraceae bacterium]
SFLFWFFYYPVMMAILISRKKGHNLIDDLSWEAARLRIAEAVENYLKADRIQILLCVAVVAIVCAVQGFSYLYSRKKVDMYHSLPVKSSRRFTVIFTNGVLIYLLPYTINLLLALAVAGINGGMNGANAQMAMAALFTHLLIFLGVYGMSILALMLTGKLLITLFAAGIFQLYELMVVSIPQIYMNEFFDYYSHYSENWQLYLSPLSWVAQAANAACKTEAGVWAGIVSQWGNILIALLLTIVYTGIAYFCYLKRPAEAAGKAMAFPKTKPWIKILLVIPFALLAAMQVRKLVGTGDTTLFAVFGMILAVVLGSCVIEVIYEADIRAAFRKKYQILIAGVCTAVIYCIYSQDLIGYDNWVPRQDQLQEAVIFIPNVTNAIQYMDEDLDYIGVKEYALDKPGVKDVEAIYEISARKDIARESEYAPWCDVAYRMKGGKVIWRRIPISFEDKDLLNRVIGTQEYKEAFYPLYHDDFYVNIKQHPISQLYFENGFRVENLSINSLDELRAAWKKDMENMDYRTLDEEFMLGQFTLEIKQENREKILTYDIYPSFTHTLVFLEEKGIHAKDYLDPSSIESIAVTNYHYELREQAQLKELEYIDWDEFNISKTFTSEQEIRELVQAIYPSGMSNRWKSDELSDNYVVTIYYKEGKEDESSYRGNNEGRLITARIPRWLDQATAYQ